jgi:structural maintenance of chromosome 2
MLKYKSAPFYILDEIDAAMDLSHTENLGTIFSENFPDSQFIIISLKEGLYGSANVLYQTHLHDGQSMVSRKELWQNKAKAKGRLLLKDSNSTQKFNL